jgi:hypothetical protein
LAATEVVDPLATTEDAEVAAAPLLEVTKFGPKTLLVVAAALFAEEDVTKAAVTILVGLVVLVKSKVTVDIVVIPKTLLATEEYDVSEAGYPVTVETKADANVVVIDAEVDVDEVDDEE